MNGVTGCQVNFAATVVKRVAKECSVLSIAITNSPVNIKYQVEYFPSKLSNLNLAIMLCLVETS